MLMRFPFLLILLSTAVLAPAAAQAGPSEAQAAARHQVHDHAIQTLPEIEHRILPMMPGQQYLGPEYDDVAMAYRLKFIRNGRVVFVDVDARTGDIIQESQ